MNEIWKDIEGYEGLYQISSEGRVRSINRIVKHNKGEGIRKLKTRILKNYSDKLNYQRIVLSKDGKREKLLVHRIVGKHFIPNPENKPYIDHINCNPSDNRVSNLRWVSQKENINNPLTIKKMEGKNNHSSKQVLQYTKDGNFIKEWGSTMDIEREIGISNVCISNCCLEKQKTAGGFIWKYKRAA